MRYGRVLTSLSRAHAVHYPSLSLSLSHNRYARLCDSAVLQTPHLTLLATRADHSHLLVDFRHRADAVGVIPLTWARRDSHAAPRELAISRLIDRALRPKLDNAHLTVQVLAAKKQSPISVDAMALLAAAAVARKSVVAVRVALLQDRSVVLFPGEQALQHALSTLLVAFSDSQTLLSLSVEALKAPVLESDILNMVETAQREAPALLDLQARFRESVDNITQQDGLSMFPRQMPVAPASQMRSEAVVTEQDLKAVYSAAYCAYEAAFVQCAEYPGKAHRAVVVTETQQRLVDAFAHLPMEAVLGEASKASKAAYRMRVLGGGIRMDGRAVDEIRDIRVETGVLNGDVHGSAVFERGDTQVMACCTFGLQHRSKKTEEYIDGGEHKQFFVHYSFPPYATGESGRLGGVASRREVGHSMLTEAALTPLLDVRNGYPYAVRLSAEVLSSDGSSSMASVCAGSQALMHAGAPIGGPVAGVAMGLITSDGLEPVEGGKDEVILTDILGAEDHFGEVDMKVAGTETGVTAVQMDTKRESGLSMSVVDKLLEKARDARRSILDTMQTQGGLKLRQSMPDHAPRVKRITVNANAVIQTMMKDRAAGLKEIETLSGADLQFNGQENLLVVEAPNKESLEIAEQLIRKAVGDLEVGAKFSARIADVKRTYAVVEVGSGCSGILHVSKMQTMDAAESETDGIGRYPDARTFLQRDEKVEVVVLESDRARNVLRFALVSPPTRRKGVVDAQIDSILKAAGAKQEECE